MEEYYTDNTQITLGREEACLEGVRHAQIREEVHQEGSQEAVHRGQGHQGSLQEGSQEARPFPEEGLVRHGPFEVVLEPQLWVASPQEL